MILEVRVSFKSLLLYRLRRLPGWEVSIPMKIVWFMHRWRVNTTDFWEEFAYLRSRQPLQLSTNFFQALSKRQELNLRGDQLDIVSKLACACGEVKQLAELWEICPWTVQLCWWIECSLTFSVLKQWLRYQGETPYRLLGENATKHVAIWSSV